MSTNEQQLTPRRSSIAAPATTESSTAARHNPATGMSTAVRQRHSAPSRPSARKAMQVAKPREPQRDERELTTGEMSRPRSQPEETRNLPITVLTTDADLSDAIKAAVAGCHPVFVVATVEEAAALATAGRSPILITDRALTQPALAGITAPLRAHEPALVTIAVGNRGEDNALIALLSAGAADRLMLKPVTAALARIVIESAIREHRTQRERSKCTLTQRDTPTVLALQPAADPVEERPVQISCDEQQPTWSEEPTQPAARETADALEPRTARVSAKIPRPTWFAVAAALALVALAVWWSPQSPQPDPRTTIKTQLADARQAFEDGRYIEPAERSAFHYYSAALALDPANAEASRGIDRIAERYMDEAQTLLLTGQLAEAGLALERARHVRPDHLRLPILGKELRDGINGILVRARDSDTRIEAAQLRDAPARSQPPKAVPRKPAAAVAQESKADEIAVRPEVRPAPLPIRDDTPVALPATQLVALQPDTARRVIDEAQRTLAPSPLENAQPVEQTGSAASTVPPTTTEPARPKLVKFVRPEYPNEAAMRGFEGWVDVGLDVTPAGDVVNPRVEDSSSGRLFHRAALVAVRQWKYEARPASEPTQHVQVRLEFKRSN